MPPLTFSRIRSLRRLSESISLQPLPTLCHPLFREFHGSSCDLKQAVDRQRKFVDNVRVWVQGGAGGQGLKKYSGVGGKGGDVYLVGSTKAQLKKLISQSPSFRAGNGADAARRSVLGEPGNDVRIPVPLGVSVTDEDGRGIGDVNKEGEALLVARGAPGGCPSSDYVGRRAAGRHLKIDLKLLADVGLVGFPNAGKSSLLSRLSRAKPKIASYPFTTLQPNVGVIEYEDLKRVSVADLPGLIEGAHVNVGLGHKFLKHVERTKLLMFVVDINGFRLGGKLDQWRGPVETILLLMKELELFNKDLLERPAMLYLNKADDGKTVEKAKAVLQDLEDLEGRAKLVDSNLRPSKVMELSKIQLISAKTGFGIDEVIGDIRDLIDIETNKAVDASTVDEKLEDFTFHLTAKRGVLV